MTSCCKEPLRVIKLREKRGKADKEEQLRRHRGKRSERRERDGQFARRIPMSRTRRDVKKWQPLFLAPRPVLVAPDFV